MKPVLALALALALVDCSHTASYAKPLKNHPPTRICVAGDDRGFDVIGTRLNSMHRLEVGIDRNGDGEVDLVETYELAGEQVRPFPFKFALAEYYDGKQDKVVIDMQGDGRCEDLRTIDPDQPEKEALGGLDNGLSYPVVDGVNSPEDVAGLGSRPSESRLVARADLSAGTIRPAAANRLADMAVPSSSQEVEIVFLFC